MSLRASSTDRLAAALLRRHSPVPVSRFSSSSFTSSTQFLPTRAPLFHQHIQRRRITHHTMATQSHACCTVPPVVADGYKEKGEFTTIDGMKTYVTGPSSATKAILIVYDIFGFFPQTLQGADILASGDKENQYQVFIPDFFEGNVCPIDWYEDKSEESQKKLGEWFGKYADPTKTLTRMPKVLDEIKDKRSSIKEFGILGFCWGGKVTNLSSQKDSLFKAAVAAHPAMVDPKDASGLSIPFAMLPSKEEEKKDVDAWEEAAKGVSVPTDVKWWPNQVHGFMAARADLKNPEVEADYKKAYEYVLNWFHKYL